MKKQNTIPFFILEISGIYIKENSFLESIPVFHTLQNLLRLRKSPSL